MDETIEIARILHDTPDLFPWVCLVIVLIFIFKERQTIRAYVNARVEYYASKRQSDAVMGELVRNNTAALENNTAALESVKADRGETRRQLAFHEQVSKERIDTVRSDIAHVQEVVNRMDATVTSNSRQIGLIEDRTDKANS